MQTMKKTSLLTLLFVLCGVVSAWADFAPEANKRYILKESSTGLYLDIQTLDIHEPGHTTHSISLNVNPRTIYFEAGAGGKWKMRNADGKYARQAEGGRHWNAVIGDDPYEWTFVETDNVVSIARADGKYISMDNPSAGQPLYCDKSMGLRFQLMEYPSVACTTAATAQNGKMHYTSGQIACEAAYNTLRFVLTESGAYYKNGAKRMSFDSFVLYNATGEVITLKDSWLTGNNGKLFANMLDGANGTYCCGAWDASNATDDWFEVTLPNGVDLGGAFSFGFVTENTTMNAKAFRIEFSYEEVDEPIEFSFVVEAPQGEDVTVTYNGESVPSVLLEGEFDAELFVANEISGYTWSIVVDEENGTVTLKYVEAPIVENPEAVVALVNRIGGKGTNKKFMFVLDPSMNSKHEVFLLGSEGKKVLVKGSTLSAITTGLGWYLNNIAHVNIAWNSMNEKTVSGDAYADLENLPLPAEEVRTTDAKYRYYLNYCTFGYSMTSWTWNRWQQEIDWMALHGINMPLQIVGLEEVWRKFLTMEANGIRKYNYTDTEAKAFVAGPAFTAWWGMNNLEGWGGTDSGTLNGGTWEGAGGVQDDAWYVRQAKLAQQILTRQRELGIHPVLPGFSGMVPTNFTTKTGVPTDVNGGKWAGGFQRPRIIDPTAERFAEIAKDYYDCLKAVMGESQYYSMDPFHEGGSISSGAYAEAYYAIYEAMEAAKSGSQWVIQQWQWDGNQKKSLNAVPAGRLIVLDLFSDGKPAFDSYKGYAPQDAVFCAIPNFGGRSGLMGRLNNVTDNYFSFKSKYAGIKGIGTAPEAIEQTPITYDLIYQLPWMDSKPDVAVWVANYAVARYGKDNAVVKEAWELLRQGPLNYGADAIQGPVEDVWAARPNLAANPASAWGKTLSHAGGIYTKARRQMLIDATYKLLSQKEVLGLKQGSIYESNYLYDLVEFGGAVMADYAYDLLLGIKAARDANDNVAYVARRDAFLALIEDVDKFKGTNLNFRLGKWTQEARDAAREVEGATSATPDWYEFNNARTILTTWSSPNTNLNDYSYRSWQGLMKDFYLPRWKYFFDNNCTGGQYGYFEWNWAHGREHVVGQTAVSNVVLKEGQAGYRYSREPEGNTIVEAETLLGKYIIPITMPDGIYYAYRYLNNDLTGQVTIVADAGATIDLAQYFGAVEGAVVSGDFIEGDVANLRQITIKSDAADGAHTGAVTLADGTVLTFAVVINPAYYGVYKINYKNGSADAPIFIGYNEDVDNNKNKGYKLIATGTYTPKAEGDKLFTMAPHGAGYLLSAQGKYLKSPTLNNWNHIMFSDSKEEAGAYIFEETSMAGVLKLRSTGEGINYVNSYDKLVFGNDKSDKAGLSTFTVEKVASYELTVTDAGVATLCLPFQVVMPEGMCAYDLAASDISEDEETGVHVATLRPVAVAGEILMEGVPVVVKAEQGTYDLDINISAVGAKGPLPGSLLCGNFVEQALVPGAGKTVCLLNHERVEFCIANDSVAMAPNSCWVELPDVMGEVQRVSLYWSDDEVSVENITMPDPSQTMIYNIAGQRLMAPQKGYNVIGNKKVIIK